MAKKKSSKRNDVSVEVSYKPSLEVDARKLGGKSLKVGGKANLNVKGRVIEERIDRYEGGKKFYRVEVDKISAPAKRRK